MPRARGGERAATLALSIALLAAGGCNEHGRPLRAASVEVSQSTVTLLVGPGGGQSTLVTAAAFNAEGDTMHLVDIDWSVVGPAHVSLSSGPNITNSGIASIVALSAGTTEVRASGGGKFASIAVTVVPVPVASLVLSVDTLALAVSILGAQTGQLFATLRDSTAAILTGRTVSWTSSVPSVASVSTNGTVTPLATGTTLIRATSGAASDSAVVEVNFIDGLPAGVDVAITTAQWTQGSQTPEGTIPMLRNGRDAVVNVGTYSAAGVPVPIAFALRLFDAGGDLLWTDTVNAPVLPGATEPWMSFVQFLVPSAQLQPGLRWEVVRDPAAALADADSTNDRYPTGTHEPVNLITPPPLRVRLVPIALLANGGVAPAVTAGHVESYLAMFRALMPIGDVEVTIGAPFGTSANFGTAPSGGAPAFWTALLPQLDAARLADAANSDAHWVGVVSPPAGFNFVTNGGWGYIPANGASTAAGTRTFALIRAGWFTDPQSTPRLFAHELGHNLGRAHAPCGLPAAPDPSFPHSGGTVGPGGNNTYDWQTGIAARAYPVVTTLGDVMGYCSPIWISSYSYAAMLNFRGEIGAAFVAPRARERVILVQGEVSGAATTISAVSAMSAEASPDDPTGTWRVDLLDAEGVVIRTQRFSLGRWDHSDTSRPFGVAVAVDAAAEGRAARVRVIGPAGASAARGVDR